MQVSGGGCNSGHVEQSKVRRGGNNKASKHAARRSIVGRADVEVGQVVEAVCRDDCKHSRNRQEAAHRNARLQQDINLVNRAPFLGKFFLNYQG